MEKHLYNKVIEWIPEGSRVLDLGTGDGAFLERLTEEKKISGEGVEKDPELVARCIERGLVVHQSDIMDGLDQYDSAAFDFVFLLGTFQELVLLQEVLMEAFRVGKQVLIAYENFSYWRIRAQLLFRGRFPTSAASPYEWYNTPNLQFFSILDFQDFCKKFKLKERRVAYFDQTGPVSFMPNFRAVSVLSLLSTENGG